MKFKASGKKMDGEILILHWGQGEKYEKDPLRFFVCYGCKPVGGFAHPKTAADQ